MPLSHYIDYLSVAPKAPSTAPKAPPSTKMAVIKKGGELVSFNEECREGGTGAI